MQRLNSKSLNRRLAAVFIVTLASAGVLSQWLLGSGCHPPPPNYMLSKASGGAAANDWAGHVDAAEYEARVAFASDATNLVTDDTNGKRDIFVHTESGSTTERVSHASIGVSTEGADHPVVQVDTSDPMAPVYVAFQEQLTSETTAGVYFLELGQSTIETIAQSSTGDSTEPDLSSDGRYVVFASEATDLIVGDTNGFSDVFVRDRTLGTTVRVSTLGGLEYADPAHSASITPTGAWVSFELSAPADPDPQVLLQQVGSTVPTAIFSGRNPAVGANAVNPVVAYEKDVAFGAGTRSAIFVYEAGVHTEISLDALGNPANGDCTNPQVGLTGSYVAFQCDPPLTSHNALNQTYVYDRVADEVFLASMSSTGIPANQPSTIAALRDANQAVMIETTATNLGGNPSAGVTRVYRVPQSAWKQGDPSCVGTGVPDDNCDGVDDDCDGSPDDGFVGAPTACGIGVCASEGQIVCTAGSTGDTCVPGTPAPGDASCDGLDNDCDGPVDEGFVGASTSCVSGGCQRAGMLVCVSGSETDTCATAACVAETNCADTLDNDTDGGADCADTDCAAFPTCTTPPTLTPVPDANVAMGTVHTIQLQATDAEGDPLLYSVQPTGIANTTLDAQSGLFTFAPDFTQPGSFLFTFSVTDGTHVVSDAATLTVAAPNPTDPSGITGFVYDAVDAEAGQTVPIAGVTVTDLESGTTTTTDALGAFTISGISGGLHHIEYDGAAAGPQPGGFTYGSYSAPIDVQNNVIDVLERPIYLPRLDSDGDEDVVSGTETILDNPNIGVSMVIDAGNVENEAGGEYTGTINVSEVPASFTPGALPSTLEPSLVVTIQPMGLTFTNPVPIEFPNTSNLPEGSEVDIWSLDHDTGEFVVTGTGQVQGGMIVTISGGIREASWHFPLSPRPGDDEQSDDENLCGSTAGGFSSRLTYRTGCLQSMISLPTYRSQDQDRGVQLVYKTSRAYPYPILTAESVIPFRSAVPNFISYEAVVGGVSLGAPTVFHTTGVPENADTKVRGGAGFPAVGFSTGTYFGHIGVRCAFGAGTVGGEAAVGAEFPRRFSIVNGINSPFGAGWSLAGFDRLHQMEDGRILYESGDGSHRVFAPASSQEASPEVDGKANLFRAITPIDHSGCQSPGGAICDGVDPGEFTLGTGGNRVIQVDSVTGTTSGWTGGCAFVGADGDAAGCRTGYTLGANGISGLTHLTHGQFLAGVFLSGAPGSDPIPLILDATFGELQSDFYPELNQTFYIGDGLDAQGNSQTFHVPANAETLALGFVGGMGGGTDTPTKPGAYADNGGSLQVNLKLIEVTSGPVTYKGPSYDRTTLTRLTDNTYELTQPDGTIVSFDVDGFMTQAVDRFGNTFSYQYDVQDRLEQITDPVNRQTVLEYLGPGGRLSKITDPYNRETTFDHDGLGNLTQVTFPDSTERNFVYDQRRLMTAEQDQRGFWTTRDYDYSGRAIRTVLADGSVRLNEAAQTRGAIDPASGEGTDQNPAQISTPSGSSTTVVTDAEGRATTYLFNERGQRTSETIADLTTTYEYDADLRLERIVPPSGQSIRVPYDELANSVTVTDEALEAAHGAQSPVTFDRDALDRLQSITTFRGATAFSYDDVLDTEALTTPEGRSEFRQLNAQGLLCARTDRFGTHWRFDYDARGNLSAIVQGVTSPSCGAAALPDARTTLFNFAADGSSLTTTDAVSRAFVSRFDTMNRPFELEAPSHNAGSALIGLGFDAEGRNESVTPPGQPAHTFDYDPRGSLDSYTPPAVAGISDPRTTYSYNGEEQQTSMTDAEGRFVTTGYNARGDVSALTTERGGYVYAYDPGGAPTGRLDSITTPQGDTLQWLYSSVYGGALHTGYSWSGEVTGSVSWTFSPDGLVDTETVNASFAASQSYDNDALMTGAGALTVARDPGHGLVTSTTLPELSGANQVNTTMSYTAFGELSEQDTFFQATELYRSSYAGYDGGAQPNNGDRDALGRIVREVETVEGVSVIYEYDYTPGGALSEVKTDGIVTESYTYDENGNRLTALGVTGTAVYDDQDRLMQYGNIAYSYTDHGDLSQKLDTVSGDVTTYDYDVFGNLRQVVLPDGTVIDYVIDALDRRIGKKVNGTTVAGYLWSDDLRVVAELDAAGNVASRFVYGDRPNVPEYIERDTNTDGTIDERYRLVHDHLGSVRLVVNTADGTIAQRLDYDAFGRVLQDTNPGFQPFGFAGGLYDPDTGLVRFGARDYDAEIGRWTNKDPIRFKGGDASLYNYALGDALNLFDPEGFAVRAPSIPNPSDAFEKIKNAFGPCGGTTLQRVGDVLEGLLDLLDFGTLGLGVATPLFKGPKITKELAEALGIDRKRLGNAVEKIKKAAGRKGGENVAIDRRTGDVLDPDTGEFLGNVFEE